MAALHPVTLITGASAGIGTALARKFAAKGHDLVLVARREAQLNTVAAEIVAAGGKLPVVVAIDLTRIDAPVRLAHELGSRGLEPEIVVNNAGFGLVGRAAALDRGAQLAIIDLNVRALTDLSLAFVEQLARHKGGILNVASLAGFVPGPGSAVYYASKAYVLSFSDALLAELKPRGIRVTTLCPGPVPTEFHLRAGAPGEEKAGLLTRSADVVALAGYKALMAGRRSVVVGWPNQAVAIASRLLPRGLVLWLMAQVQAQRHDVDLTA